MSMLLLPRQTGNYKVSDILYFRFSDWLKFLSVDRKAELAIKRYCRFVPLLDVKLMHEQLNHLKNFDLLIPFFRIIIIVFYTL